MTNNMKIDSGQTALAHYTGCLEDDKKFDTNIDRNNPLAPLFNAVTLSTVGMRYDMQVSGKRKPQLSSELTYGERRRDTLIAPDAALIVEIAPLGI